MYKAAVRRKEKMNREVERRKKANERAARQRLEKDEKEARRRQRHLQVSQRKREMFYEQIERQIQVDDEMTKQERQKLKEDRERRLRFTSGLVYEEERPRRTWVLFEDLRQVRQALRVVLDSLFRSASVLDSEEIRSSQMSFDSAVDTATPTSNLGTATSFSTADVYEEERQRPGTNESLKNEDSPRSSTALQHDAAAADPDQCSICYDWKKDCFCAPCGHQLCRICLYSLEKCVCPFCRAEIESTGRIKAPIKSKYY